MRRQDLERMPMAPFAKSILALGRDESRRSAWLGSKRLGGGGLGTAGATAGDLIELLGMITGGDAVRSANRQRLHG